MGVVFIGVFMFTLIILLLVVMILYAKSKLVSTGNIRSDD